jgi:hypothetical protein
VTHGKYVSEHFIHNLALTHEITVFNARYNIQGKCTCEIKSRIAMEKGAFNKKRALFTSKMDLELRKKLVKCYSWSIAL